MEKLIGLFLGLSLLSSSAFAMGVTRSRDMNVTGVEVTSPVILKTEKGESITLSPENQSAVFSTLHTSVDGFPRSNYYLELDGKDATGNAIAIRFDLANKVSFDSNDYPQLPTSFIEPSTTQQGVGIQVVMTQPGQWSTPITQTMYQECQRAIQQYVCTDQGPRQYCTWQTVFIPGHQLVQVTSSVKTDGYTMSLVSGDRGTSARVMYSQDYENDSEEALSACL